MKPAVEKLSLSTRKNLRDAYESKLPEYQTSLSTILGTSWTITSDPKLLYANCQRDDLHDRLGEAITWYLEPLKSNFQRWVKDYGPEGVAELNAITPKHVLELRPQEATKFNYGGFEIKDGVLGLVFAEDNFAVNCDNVSDPDSITTAVKDAQAKGMEGAPASKLNIEARKDVRKEWDAKKEDLRKKIADLTAIPDLEFEVRWEEIAAGILSRVGEDENEEYRMARDRDQNMAQLGGITRLYFEAMAEYLKREKFGSDDMLQEGLQEALTGKKIGLRMVEKLGRNYNETVLEEGVLWMQTIPKEWRVNIDAVADTVMDLL